MASWVAGLGAFWVSENRDEGVVAPFDPQLNPTRCEKDGGTQVGGFGCGA
jgi:hypothetical protein